MKQLGAEIDIENGYVIARTKRLIGTRILFETATVGGSENIMMAATLAKGTTVLENVAKEPEVVDLARYLKSMGAKIDGEGSSVVTIEGVDELHPATHNIIPDRIEERLVCSIGQAIDDHDGIPWMLVDMPQHEVRPDETGTTSDEEVHMANILSEAIA